MERENLLRFIDYIFYLVALRKPSELAIQNPKMISIAGKMFILSCVLSAVKVKKELIDQSSDIDENQVSVHWFECNRVDDIAKERHCICLVADSQNRWCGRSASLNKKCLTPPTATTTTSTTVPPPPTTTSKPTVTAATTTAPKPKPKAKPAKTMPTPTPSTTVSPPSTSTPLPTTTTTTTTTTFPNPPILPADEKLTDYSSEEMENGEAGAAETTTTSEPLPDSLEDDDLSYDYEYIDRISSKINPNLKANITFKVRNLIDRFDDNTSPTATTDLVPISTLIILLDRTINSSAPARLAKFSDSTTTTNNSIDNSNNNIENVTLDDLEVKIKPTPLPKINLIIILFFSD